MPTKLLVVLILPGLLGCGQITGKQEIVKESPVAVLADKLASIVNDCSITLLI